MAHVFCVRATELGRALKVGSHEAPARRRGLGVAAEKSAKVPTEITEDTIRALALPLGFVDVKVCGST